MTGVEWSFIILGGTIGWVLHCMFDAVWDIWVKPRLMRIWRIE